MLKTVILTLATLLFAASPLLAQQRATPEQLERFLRRFPDSDANKDGKLTLEEVRAFNQRRRANQDRNQDGRRQAAPPTHADIAYGNHPKQRFDLWLAKTSDGKPTPLCIYIHGGGFRGGDKRVNAAVVRPYLDAGVSFASMNYRLTEGGKYPYPTAMHDAARGLQTIRSRAKEWNLDLQRVACYGGSAGAGISLWLAFHDDLADPKAKDPIARQSTRILAAGASNGQSSYDMQTIREWFGGAELTIHPALVDFYALTAESGEDSKRVRELMVDASPITHLSKDDAPVYMTYNRGDVAVDEGTEPGVWVHHVRLGLKLQEAMKPLGLECRIQAPGFPEKKYGGMPQFLIAKLKAD